MRHAISTPIIIKSRRTGKNLVAQALNVRENDNSPDRDHKRNQAHFHFQRNNNQENYRSVFNLSFYKFCFLALVTIFFKKSQ